ncbi:MAG: hypothetical protein ACFFCS_17605 [Candidatus Hodarchaeota archaeon]
MSTINFWLSGMAYCVILVIRLVLFTIVSWKKQSDEVSMKRAVGYGLLLVLAGLLSSLLVFIPYNSILPQFLLHPGPFVTLMLVLDLFIVVLTSKLARVFVKEDEMDAKAWKYVCDDGHVVRSRGEVMIDNCLHRMGIEHEYEKQISLGGNKVKYDWYLPGQDVYIEYWGYYGKTYKKRRKEKEELYKQHEKKLISILNKDLGDINKNLKAKLLKFLEKVELERPSRCFNCGIMLDRRYSR